MRNYILLLLAVISFQWGYAQNERSGWKLNVGAYTGFSRINVYYFKHYAVAPNPTLGINYTLSSKKNNVVKFGVNFMQYGQFRDEQRNSGGMMNDPGYGHFYMKSYVIAPQVQFEIQSRRKKIHYLFGSTLSIPIANHVRGVFYSNQNPEFKDFWFSGNEVPGWLRFDIGIAWNGITLFDETRTHKVFLSYSRLPSIRSMPTYIAGSTWLLTYSCDLPFGNFRNTFRKAS